MDVPEMLEVVPRWYAIQGANCALGVVGETVPAVANRRWRRGCLWHWALRPWVKTWSRPVAGLLYKPKDHHERTSIL